MLESRKREIRVKAEEFRNNCKVSKYGIINLFEECNRKNYKLIRYPLGENGDMGFVLKRDDDIVIFTNSAVRMSREIFTLAHEIGHVVLHFGKENSFIDNQHTLFGTSETVAEQEANFFAANLLMPKDEVLKFYDLEFQETENKKLSAIDITRIMSEFKVSFEVVLNRLEDLGIIDENEKIRLNNEKNISRVGNMLKATGGDRRLNEASMEVALPFEYLNYTISNYNRGAIPRDTLMRTLAYYNFCFEDISDKVVEPTDKELDLEELIGGLEG
ncbi:MAG: ImmA/IrrE family metallo-endopeptidase [Lachnospiraceae bacterium]|nr:ImmA/IrrE family metallo-endopeptidase [Lachnospiraceae bacterium]